MEHRSAQAQADLAVIRARAGLVRARTGLVNTARGLVKSYGERLRSCNIRNMNPEKAEGLSPELQQALGPLLLAAKSLSDFLSLVTVLLQFFNSYTSLSGRFSTTHRMADPSESPRKVSWLWEKYPPEKGERNENEPEASRYSY